MIKTTLVELIKSQNFLSFNFSSVDSNFSLRQNLIFRRSEITACLQRTLGDNESLKISVPLVSFLFAVECTQGEVYNLTSLQCEKCPLNTYMNTYGALKCTPCQNGKVTRIEGSVGCVGEQFLRFYFSF